MPEGVPAGYTPLRVPHPFCAPDIFRDCCNLPFRYGVGSRLANRGALQDATISWEAVTLGTTMQFNLKETAA